MAIEMVVPMENLADPIPIDFTFKCTNTDDIPIYVQSELVTPPAGWNGVAEQHGSLGVGVDDYFLNDNYTRDRPANLTEETVNYKISYFSDAGYSVLITSETLEYTITYVDFDDVVFTVVDDDTFEIDVEGWARTDEVGTLSLARDTALSRTGIASLKLGSLNTGDVGYAYKSFTIGNVTGAFIRIWHYQDNVGQPALEWIFEIITDAGAVVLTRTLRLAMDGNPIGGTEIMQQWICSGLKLPVNGTFQVRLRVRVENGMGIQAINFDDIRVVQY